MAELFKVNVPVRKPLFEGVQGENEARSIQFDITPWVEELGDGAVTATAKRSQDSQPYPITVTQDGNTVTWKPTSTDTAFAGVGSFQLEYTVDSVLAKTCIWSTMVAPSLDPAGDPPDPYDNWMAEMREIEANAIQSASDAAASAASLSGLESDLDGNGIVSIKTLTPKTLIATSVGVGNVVDLTQNTNSSTDSVIVPCQAGDMFLITGTGWNTERLWAFVDSSNKLISISAGNATASNVLITAPMNASKLVCNFKRTTGNPYRLVAFDTAGLAVKAGHQNITDSTGALICSDDLNNLPLNSIYGIVPYTNLQHMPYSETGSSYGGLIFTISKEKAMNATATQVLLRRDGNVYIRQNWSGYGAWHEYATADLSLTGTKTNIVNENVNSICSGDANNLPNNSIYGFSVSLDRIANMPFYPLGVNENYGGCIMTFGKESARGYGDTQIYIGYQSKTYARVYTGVWHDWRCLTDQEYHVALGVGDSICEGWRNNNMGFVGMLGVQYQNLGITGATLGVKQNHTQIYTEIENLSGAFDIVIADGGINDYYFNVPLGDMPTRPAFNDTEADAIDKTTVSGGLEYLLYLMIKKVPKAQRYFLITHKTKNFPYTQNSAGYTQQDLHDRIVAICNIYNTEVIDVYKDSIIHSGFDVYVSPTAYSNSNTEITKQYYVDNDGIHPLWLGYQEGYMPIIKKALLTGTRKYS